MARIRQSVSICLSWFNSIDFKFPFLPVENPVTQVSNKNSTPFSVINSRIRFITSARISVPICGLFSYKICSGAPNFTNVSRTKRFLPMGSLTNVFNFPSEKVPAPPSPNWTFEAVSKTPVSQNFCTSAVRSSTFLPRSVTIGWKPSDINA